jgi:hypothetical protein
MIDDVECIENIYLQSQFEQKPEYFFFVATTPPTAFNSGERV